MSTRKTNGSHAAATTPVDMTQWNDLPRQQMAAAAQANCALFRGFEAIRTIQQKAAHQALAHRRTIAEKLKEPCHPMDLVAVQGELLRFDLQGAAMYWQQLGAAVLEMQREMLGSASAGSEPQGEPAPATFQAYPPMPGLNPFFFNVSGGQRATSMT